MTELVKLNNVEIAYQGKTILQGINFSIQQGEIVTIVGPNGSGKSSMIKSIIGAILPEKGTIWKKPKLRIGYVPQKLTIDQTLPMSAGRFMTLPDIDKSHAIRAAQTAGIEYLFDMQMSHLSGGQFQRVLLARAILNTPDILLLDEATQGLDQQGSAAFYKQIESIRKTIGCAIIMVSHELHVVMAASDRVICLNGHICCEGHPEHVASAPEYRALFGTGTGGALALYRHEHNHTHEHNTNLNQGCSHD